MERKNNQSNLDFEEYDTDIENESERNKTKKYKEEMASEIMDNSFDEVDEESNDTEITNNIYAWLAIGLSLLSFLIMPYIFGTAAIILGFIAQNRGRVMLGTTAIVIGALSIILRMLIF